MKKIFLFVFLLFTAVVISGCSENPAKYNTFAMCLTEKGAIMYGTDWCSHCQNQKKMFGNSFQYVNYVDCDKNKDECVRAGVQGYPTWKIDGENYAGEHQLYKLSSLTGCDLIED